MKKLRRRITAFLLMAAITASFLPAVSAEEAVQPLSDDATYEYVLDTDGIDSGAVYAIVAPNANHSILYHASDKTTSDQVGGTVKDNNKLTLNAGFDVETQTWTITGNDTDGYTLQSVADSFYLNINGETTVDAKGRVPVTSEKQTLVLEAAESEPGTYAISRIVDETKYYVYHADDNSQYHVTKEPTYFSFYKQTVVEEGEPDPEEPSLEIPGYTQVTGTDLDASEYYLIVSQDSEGNLYALYASEAGLSVSSGALTGTSGACTAKLTVSDGQVSATDFNGTSLDMTNLGYTVGVSGDKYSFKSNGYYLALTAGDKMFATSAAYLSVAASSTGYIIRTGTNGSDRMLSMNVNGDSKSAYPNHITDFWGPRPADSTPFPIYLYTKDGAVVEADKTELSAKVDEVNELAEADYSATSWSGLQTALTAAQAVLVDKDATAQEIDAALSALTSAVNALIPKKPDNIAGGAPKPGTTQGQPFASGTGGSTNFRIPSLITLSNGDLLAAIDARWNHLGDACALDTIISKSSDGGKTWNYSYANFFNDSTNAKDAYATAFIDPVMIQGEDGTIYLMVDLFPGGVGLNTAPVSPAASTGYEEVNGTKRLVLYGSPKTGEQTSANYTHYVGDFVDGFAPVYAKDDGENAVYYVDQWYYLYDTEKAPLYCKQLGSDQYVAQNVFFYNAELHVRNASYLWLIKSIDNGKTWSAPLMLNEQVRTGDHAFYGVGPGAGLCLDDGTIMLPCYTFTGGTTNSSQLAGFIWSKDGETWHRSENATPDARSHWSSESCLVQINETTVRHFYRDIYSTLYYTDHTWNGAEWKAGTPVNTGVTKTYNNQLSAIRYSKTIDGKTAILVSTAASGSNSRTNGKIYTLLLNEDNTLYKVYEYTVTTGAYSYSSLTEMSDGNIALLYEGSGIVFTTIPIADIADGAILDGKQELTVPLYGTRTETVTAAPTEGELAQLDSTIVSVKVDGSTVTYTGLKDGTTSYTSNGVTITITVAPEVLKEVSLTVGDSASFDLEVGTIAHAADSTIAKAEVIMEEIDISETGCYGQLGSNANYSGEEILLSNALYTFTKNDDGNYTISSYTKEGKEVYLNIKSGGATIPNQTASTAIAVTENNDTEHTFSLVDQASSGNGGYLYFHRNTTQLYFNRNSRAAAPDTAFLLYCRAAGDTSSTEIPGYVQVTSADSITSGSQYLIVAAYNGSYYALYPSTDPSSQYAHVIKVVPSTERKSLSITGVAPGTTDVMVDGVIYRVTVTAQEINVTDVTLDKTTLTLTSGGAETLTATVQPSNATNQKVTWGSSDSSVATVDQNGKVTAVGAGTATITVTTEDGGKTATCTVTVKAKTDDNSGNSGGSSTPTYPVSVPASSTKNGDVTTSPKNASRGDTVTITVKPDDGYELDELTVKDANGKTIKVTEGRNGKYTFTMPASKVTVNATFVKADEAAKPSDLPFADVSTNDWFIEAVEYVYDKDLMSGISGTSFAPNATLTRAMIAQVLYNYDSNAKAGLSGSFTDVTSGTWYADAVNWASYWGVVSGYGNGLFGPDNNVTREQLATILYNYAKLKGYDTNIRGDLSKFTDVNSVSSYAVTPMQWAVGAGLISGMGNDTLSPGGNATRAQVAVILMKFCENIAQ